MNALRFTSIVVRICAIGLVAGSPWIRSTSHASSGRSVIYVVDRSASLGDDGLAEESEFLRRAWSEARGATLGVVAFDGRAEVLAPLGATGAPIVHEGTEPWSSDLAGGIRLAIGALPSHGHRSIVLLTDARPTRGDAATEVRRASALGIRVDVVPLEPRSTTLPIVTGVRPRALHVAEHQPVALDVDVRIAGNYLLKWTRDGVPMPPRPVHALEETADVTVELVDPAPPPGVHVYEVKAQSWAGWGDERAHKDGEHAPATLAAVSVEGKAHATVFSSAGAVPAVLKAALGEAGLDARSLPLEQIADPSSYSGADLVVLDDVRVSGAATDEAGLTRTAQASLVDYVQQGGGLLVTGGVFGLAPEYAGTPIARVIPVEIEDRGHVEDPPVALAIMLDRSGSMSAPVGESGHTKIELAIEASLAAADALRPTDQVAVASVDTETHWDVPLGTVERLGTLREEVRKVGAGGGGIYVHTAMKDAYAALEKVKSPIRHVILFSDTSDSEEQVEGCPFDGCTGPNTVEKLAREARGKGITTTVVGIGEEEAKDTAFLRRVAAAAGGRFYLTSEGADLRRIFLSETRVLAQSNLRERKTRVSSPSSHPAIEGVAVPRLPELAAYVEAGRRVGADDALLLTDPSRPEGRPMLATWRYGLGKSGAITTDFAEGWGGAWASSPDAAQVLRQTVRFLLRQNAARRADAQVRIRDRVVEVDIELPPDAPENAAPRMVEVHAVDRSGASRKLAMRIEPRGPGRWTARGHSSGEPIVIVRARDARGALMAEAVGREDRTSELSGAGADAHLAGELTRLGDGRMNPLPEQTLEATKRPARELSASWPIALLIAAGLVVVDLVLRRLGEGKRRPTSSALALRASHGR